MLRQLLLWTEPKATMIAADLSVRGGYNCSLQSKSDCLAVNYVYGLGGRDVKVEDMIGIYSELEKIAEAGEVTEPYRYMGVRE